jgi:hypothetical protein
MKTLTRWAQGLLLAVCLGALIAPINNVLAEEGYQQAELEQMLAPVALYPDTVLSHILIASTHPIEVVQAARWRKANRDLLVDQALAAVKHKPWDPSVQALVAFPQILDNMNEDLGWTTALGSAFTANEAAVLESIQSLRERAYAAGNLKSLEHFNVQREDQKIVIEPAKPQVVYIPHYDTRVVYGHWHWHNHPPVYWEHPRAYPHRYTRHHGTHVYWTDHAHLPASFFFSTVHWHGGHVVIIEHHSHHDDVFYSGRRLINHPNAHAWRHNRERYIPPGRHDPFNRHTFRERHSWQRNAPAAEQGRREILHNHNRRERLVPERDLQPPAGVVRQGPGVQRHSQHTRQIQNGVHRAREQELHQRNFMRQQGNKGSVYRRSGDKDTGNRTRYSIE